MEVLVHELKLGRARMHVQGMMCRMCVWACVGVCVHRGSTLLPTSCSGMGLQSLGQQKVCVCVCVRG